MENKYLRLLLVSSTYEVLLNVDGQLPQTIYKTKVDLRLQIADTLKEQFDFTITSRQIHQLEYSHQAEDIVVIHVSAELEDKILQAEDARGWFWFDRDLMPAKTSDKLEAVIRSL